MSRWDRPPAGTTVAAFFESWLPDAFAASGRQAPGAAPLGRATLSGPGGGARGVRGGGGAWDVRASENELHIAQAAREAPDVWLRQSATDFLTALSPDPDPDL